MRIVWISWLRRMRKRLIQFSESNRNQEFDVLNRKQIRAWAAIVLLVSVCSVWGMLHFFGDDPKGSSRLESIRIATTIIVGTGGAIALLLAARRQQFAEIDGTERRITELQIKATDQLGHEKSAVRQAGLHSLERLAQDHPQHRQAIVNIICAYLRIPFTPPFRLPINRDKVDRFRGKRAPLWMRPAGAAVSNGVSKDQKLQEQVVRKTAQGILASHLRKVRNEGGPRFPMREKDSTFWKDIAINLEGAVLVDADFSGCEFEYAFFDRASFIGSETSFFDASFVYASFRDSIFESSTRHASFQKSRFILGVDFERAEFNCYADFTKSRLTSGHVPAFFGTQFCQGAAFARANIRARSQFSIFGTFYGDTTFRGAIFEEEVDVSCINAAFFERPPDFSETIFRDFRFEKLDSGWYVMVSD